MFDEQTRHAAGYAKPYLTPVVVVVIEIAVVFYSFNRTPDAAELTRSGETDGIREPGAAVCGDRAAVLVRGSAGPAAAPPPTAPAPAEPGGRRHRPHQDLEAAPRTRHVRSPNTLTPPPPPRFHPPPRSSLLPSLLSPCPPIWSSHPLPSPLISPSPLSSSPLFVLSSISLSSHLSLLPSYPLLAPPFPLSFSHLCPPLHPFPPCPPPPPLRPPSPIVSDPHCALDNHVLYLCNLPCSIDTTEQVMEIVLPRRCPVGHLQLKYFLHAAAKKQSVLAYLVKPSKAPSAMGSRPQSHSRGGVVAAARRQGAVLCGPVDLRAGLDLSGQSGQVTLTSPELIKLKNRVLLLVIVSSSSEADQPNQDCLEEVSVTIRRFRDNSRPDCWQRRLGMLQDAAFHEQLLAICSSSSSSSSSGGRVSRPEERAPHEQEEMVAAALKLLCWIAGTCMHEAQQG